MKNELEAEASNSFIFLTIFGRGGGIRTRDPLHPMQVRYQAALRPDEARIIAREFALPQQREKVLS
jgi:hypothetical protein